MVHNETSTGVTSDIGAIRQAIDAAGHPALLMVDTISGLACADYRHDEWGVDVTVGGSQKGLMLPPGLSLQRDRRQGARGEQDGEAAARLLGLGRDRRDEQDRLLALHAEHQPALRPREALDMLLGEGLDNVFARHERWAEAVRGAVRAWGLPIQCADAARIRRC